MMLLRGVATGRFGLVASVVVFGLAAAPSFAQQARFAGCYDTIEMNGSTVVETAATYEAVLRPDGVCTDGSWVVFCDHKPFQADKLFAVSPTEVFIFNFCLSGAVTSALHPITSDWHHIAWVYDGALERVYIDGVLVKEEATSGNICDAVDKASIGAASREGANPVYTGFQGVIESLRISSVARYTGPSFTPPLGDFASDADTQLLLNFEEPAGSTIVHDGSPLARVGTLGLGFKAATSPELGCFFGCGAIGDLNNDGAVNAVDLAIMIGAWGTTGPGDLDGDGTVGASDIAILLGAWTTEGG